jgi:vacuolar-type H+-ATPase subunit E/Vma4
MTEEKLVQKILNDAAKEAAAMIDAAAASAEQKVAAAKIAAAERKEKAVSEAKKNLARAGEQAALAKEVENIKSKINAKQEIMSAVFDAVRSNIINAKPADKRALTDALTKRYAKTGDKVTPAGDGIIISNKNYDIDLSLDVLLADLRGSIELEVAKMLF